MNFSEIPAHGPHQSPGTAPDLQRSTGAAISRRKTLQFRFQSVDYIRRRVEEFPIVLASAAEGDVVVSVFHGALVPVGAHLFYEIGIGHSSRAILSLMAIAFKKVTLGPLQAFTANAPNSALIGVIGENGSGKRAVLRLAAGLDTPSSGSVSAGKTRRFLGPSDELSFDPADTLLLEHTLARLDAVAREVAAAALGRCRRQGSTILLVSHEEPLLRRLCDEIWWLHEGKLMGRGDPVTMLESYREHV